MTLQTELRGHALRAFGVSRIHIYSQVYFLHIPSHTGCMRFTDLKSDSIPISGMILFVQVDSALQTKDMGHIRFRFHPPSLTLNIGIMPGIQMRAAEGPGPLEHGILLSTGVYGFQQLESI